MAADQLQLQDLWWPPFGSLYAALQSRSSAGASGLDENLKTMLSRSEVWLRLGLLGFKAPASESQLVLRRDPNVKLAHGQMLPIKAELLTATIALSQHLVSQHCAWQCQTAPDNSRHCQPRNVCHAGAQ